MSQSQNDDTNPSREGKPLWSVNHSYYGAEGHMERLDSWAEALEELTPGPDPDMNMLYRWDWHMPEEPGEPQKLSLHFLMPRKDGFWSMQIKVTEADEPSIREWLRPRFGVLLALWAPMSPAEACEPPEGFSGNEVAQ